MKLFAYLLTAIPFFADANPVSPTLTLVNESGFNELTITASIPLLGSDSAVTTVTGNSNVTLDIDPATATTTELTFNSSSFAATPISLTLGNFFTGTVDIDSSALGGEVSTTAPPAPATPGTNGNSTFDASLHELLVNSGTLDVNGNITLVGAVDATVDLSDTPFSGNTSDLGSVTLSETSSTPSENTYQATIILPVSFSDTIEDPTIPVDISVNVTGTIKATGPVTISNYPDFATWAISQGMPGIKTQDILIGQTLPAGLIHALGYDLADVPISPLTISQKTPNLILSPTGSRAPLYLKSTPAFGAFPYITVFTIVPGSTGSQLLPTSTTPTAFFRLSLTD